MRTYTHTYTHCATHRGRTCLRIHRFSRSIELKAPNPKKISRTTFLVQCEEPGLDFEGACVWVWRWVGASVGGWVGVREVFLMFIHTCKRARARAQTHTHTHTHTHKHTHTLSLSLTHTHTHTHTRTHAHHLRGLWGHRHAEKQHRTVAPIRHQRTGHFFLPLFFFSSPPPTFLSSLGIRGASAAVQFDDDTFFIFYFLFFIFYFLHR